MKRPALQSAANWSAAVSGSSMTSSPRAAAASKKAMSWPRARGQAGGVKGGAECGEAAGLGDADPEHLLCGGREQEGREARGHPPQRHLDRLAAVVAAHHLAGAADLGLHHRLEELPLVGEIAVERRLGGAGGAGDLVDAGALVAAIHEDLARAFQHLGAFRAALHGASTSLTSVFLHAGPPERLQSGNGNVQFKSTVATT